MQSEDLSPQNPNAKKRKHKPKANSSGKGGRGSSTVSSLPVGNAEHLTFELVKAKQSIEGKQYRFMPVSDEESYFTSLIFDVLKHLPVAGAPMHPVFEAIVNALGDGSPKDVTNIFNLHTIFIGQLRIERSPDISSRTPPGNSFDHIPDSFESYEVEKDGKSRAMVHAPVR